MLPTQLRVATFLVTNGTWWALARVLAILFAYSLKDWTQVVFFLSFCTCTVLLVAQLRPGSVGQAQQASRQDQEASKNDSWHQVFTHRRLWKRTVACSFCFFICGLIFYGFNLARKVFLTRSIFVNMLITGLIDFTAEVLAAVTCHSTKRTLPVFMVVMFLNGLCCLVMAPFEACTSDDGIEHGWEYCSTPHKTIVFMGHFSALFTGGASLNILWLSTASAFPRKIR